MKIRTLTLNTLNKDDLLNIRTISHDKFINKTLHLLSPNRKHNHKNEKESKTNTSNHIFKNYALLKSLSINTNYNYEIPKIEKYNITQVPKKYKFHSNFSYKKRPYRVLKLVNYCNDEKFFCTSKNNKRFLFPKDNYIIKKSRINHDINYFNVRNIITDYTKQYEKNSYQIKTVVNKDIFVNKIKNDLLKMKFGNKIKIFDNL